MKLAPVFSIEQLKSKVHKNDDYKKLVIKASMEMFHLTEDTTWEDALNKIEDYTKSSGDSDGVIEEVNSYINDI